METMMAWQDMVANADGFACRLWIALSSSVILFNKWILSTAKFSKSPFLFA